jgi:polyphosphate kinase 2 (PPK2 family)
VWLARYEQINHFEKMLHDTGTTILKFFLHISRNEQKKRLEERKSDPRKNWKHSPDDAASHSQWDAYQQAYDAMLQRCTTPWAPWRVIPADQKWYRNYAVCRAMVEKLREIDPQFPRLVDED